MLSKDQNPVNYDLKQVMSNADKEVKDINAWPIESTDRRIEEMSISPMTQKRKKNEGSQESGTRNHTAVRR